LAQAVRVEWLRIVGFGIVDECGSHGAASHRKLDALVGNVRRIWPSLLAPIFKVQLSGPAVHAGVVHSRAAIGSHRAVDPNGVSIYTRCVRVGTEWAVLQLRHVREGPLRHPQKPSSLVVPPLRSRQSWRLLHDTEDAEIDLQREFRWAAPNVGVQLVFAR